MRNYAEIISENNLKKENERETRSKEIVVK
jgi:hypothetical protein